MSSIFRKTLIFMAVALLLAASAFAGDTVVYQGHKTHDATGKTAEAFANPKYDPANPKSDPNEIVYQGSSGGDFKEGNLTSTNDASVVEGETVLYRPSTVWEGDPK